MNTVKLRDALEELHAQRGVIDSAISHLESAISVLESAGAQQTTSPATDLESSPAIPLAPLAIIRGATRSYIDDAELMLQREGRTLHARDLAEGMSRLRGKEIPRASMESTLIRHITDLKDRARIAKMGPSLYGLPAWVQHAADPNHENSGPVQPEHLTA
jgi:hypothetical protein